MQTAKPDPFVLESIINADHLLQLPSELPEGLTVRITIEPIQRQRSEPEITASTTNSEIGRLLHAARQTYMDGGGKPMDQDQILAQVRTQRGEVIGIDD